MSGTDIAHIITTFIACAFVFYMGYRAGRDAT